MTLVALLPVILHIESSTLTCSVAVSQHGNVLALKESHDYTYSHSEKLVVHVDEVIREAGLKPSNLSAVCVSKGPGSYTGLRIGVSAAKGLCYGLGIPLLSVGSLESMAQTAMLQFKNEMNEADLLCPMIDARRMEVYTSVFDRSFGKLKEVSAEIIDENSFATELSANRIAFFGDGAAKCKELMAHSNAIFLSDFNPSAIGMIALAEEKYAEGKFEDLAYFEPYYLKDFVAGLPKKMF